MVRWDSKAFRIFLEIAESSAVEYDLERGEILFCLTVLGSWGVNDHAKFVPQLVALNFVFRFFDTFCYLLLCFCCPIEPIHQLKIQFLDYMSFLSGLPTKKVAPTGICPLVGAPVARLASSSVHMFAILPVRLLDITMKSISLHPFAAMKVGVSVVLIVKSSQFSLLVKILPYVFVFSSRKRCRVLKSPIVIIFLHPWHFAIISAHFNRLRTSVTPFHSPVLDRYYQSRT